MSKRSATHFVIGFACMAAILLIGQPAAAQSTAFTYQGELLDNGLPAGGDAGANYTLWFTPYRTEFGGDPVASPPAIWNGIVKRGRFTAQLDFGANSDPIFNGQELWFEIVVNGQLLAQRQRFLPAPIARKAIDAWSTTGNLGTSPNNGNYLGTADSSPLMIKALGGVGINKTNPGSALDVNGAITGVGISSTTNAGFAGSFDGGAGDHGLYVDGKVGINTTTPSEAMDVIGNVRASAFKVSDGLFQFSQGGSLELGRQTGGVATPYIDFHHGDSSDYNVRIINDDYGHLSVNFVNGSSGTMYVNGNLGKAGGSFKIDHPLDPANKYLLHSFVESPDMMNIYNGVVVTDTSGRATVTLPEWFESLNRDFRYQLTVIDESDGDDFVLAKITQEVNGNRFAIRTNRPSVKVSWQVTGIRHDAWADAHRIPVEENKSEKNRGRYLHPELFGATVESLIGAVAEQEPGISNDIHSETDQPN